MSQQRKKISGGGLIRRYPKSDKAAIPFIKFGPLFGQDEEGSIVKKAKEESWKHVVIFSKSSEATITEIYMSSIRKIENEAKASYFPDPVLDSLSSKDFRDMMLKDGCLFLQLCFSLFRNIIDVDDDVKFDDFPHLRNISLSNRYKWIESMLHVGNQIPLIVIKELLKKSYFSQVVQKGKWKEPSFDPAKKALFRILVSPLLHTGGVWRMKSFPYCIGKRTQRLTRWNRQLEECCDVLHGIHLLFLGQEIDPEKEEYEDDDDDDDVEDDVEGNKRAKDNDTDTDVARYKAKKDNDDDDDDDSTKLKNVIKLKQSGIHFRVSKEEGIRGITFKSSLIYPKLYLPPLFIGSHTQLLLQRLRQYEQNLDPSLREVSSYLMFMRDLVRTSQDAKILALDGIIKGNRKYVQKLPSILIDLTGPDDSDKIIDTSLNTVKIEINSFYRPPWVTSYFTIVFLLTLLGMIISIIQTVYAMLAYHKPPPSN